MFEQVDQLLSRKTELEELLSQDSWETRAAFITATQEYAHIQSVLELKKAFDGVVQTIQDNQTLLEESAEDPEMMVVIQEDLDAAEFRYALLEKKLMQKLLPHDSSHGRPVIAEIRAGTGGQEASLFAGELYRMYQRFAEVSELQMEILSSSQSEMGGIKEVVFCIKGSEAWSLFKYESGTHRVQRVPVTETSGRIHTSAVTVAILPEPEDVDIVIDPTDLRIDTYRSSGPGGQSVNTMDSAIRITHAPSGLVVTCQDEKSQHKNKAKAMRILRARLLEKKQHDENIKRSVDRKNQVGTGDRSEKIRTYNFPQNRVTDHRIGKTWYNLEEIMEGRLEPVQLSLAEEEYKQHLEALS